MSIRMLFFGVLSEAIGPEIPHATPAATVGALRRRLIEEFPASATQLKTCMVAVNASYVDDARALSEGDEVAFLPPVSGG